MVSRMGILFAISLKAFRLTVKNTYLTGEYNERHDYCHQRM